MRHQHEKRDCSPTVEDRGRLARLAEEIDARTGELARILTRNLDVSPRGTLAQYTLRTGSNETTGLVVVMHEVTFTDGSKLCHDGNEGVTCAGPCPCS